MSESLLGVGVQALGTLRLERQDSRTPLSSHTGTTDVQGRDLQMAQYLESRLGLASIKGHATS